MTINITPITKNQWFKVLKVAVFLAASFLIALVPAWLTKNLHWLAVFPGVNLILVALAQLFQTEATTYEGQLTPVDQALVGQVGRLIEPQLPQSDLPTTATPPSAPGQ